MNLRELYGDKYKVKYDESFYAENPKFRGIEESELQIIPGKYGHVYSQDNSLLAVSTNSRGLTMKRLIQIGVIIYQNGDDGFNGLFDPLIIDQVAEIIHARKRRKPLTQDQKNRLIDQIKVYQFKKGGGDRGDKLP